MLNDALDQGKHILLEGRRGTLLDVDHGTYRSSSSDPTAGGACAGSGIGPTRISRVLGILKAYTTRVGAGPFPTELFDDDGERLRSVGGEVGVTTGRDRRCGWFDGPIARNASRINGLTDIFLTKLDVLSGWDRIPVCVAYEVDGQRFDDIPPMNQRDFAIAKPVYEYLPGWTQDISVAGSSRTCHRTLRRTCGSSKNSRSAASPRSGSVRTVPRPSWCTTSSTERIRSPGPEAPIPGRPPHTRAYP